MRHNIAGKKLGRNTSWRKATLRDMAKSVLIRERICTTKGKAKEARKLVDKLITLGKKGTLAHRRRAFAILCQHQLVSDLFNKIAPRFRARQGGYTRIIPASLRRGDNAQMVFLELTEKSEVIVSKSRSAATDKKKKIGTEIPAVSVEKDVEVTEKPAEKKAVPQPPAPKPLKKKAPLEEKGKSEKRSLGGIRKMFRRKVGE